MVVQRWIASSALQIMCEPCACSGAIKEEGGIKIENEEEDHEGPGEVKEEEGPGEVKEEELLEEVEDHKTKPAKLEAMKKDEVDTGAGPETQGAIQAAEDGSLWRLLWVKVGPDGQPSTPVEVKATLGKAPAGAKPKGGATGRFVPPVPKAEPGPPASSTSSTPPGSSTTSAADIASAELKDVLASIQSFLAKAAAPQAAPELEEPGPKLILTPEAKAWKLSMRGEGVQRMAWPLPANKDVDLTKFKAYLVGPKNVIPSTADKNLLCMQYVYGMFQLPERFSQEGFWASLYLTGVAEIWAALPIMSVKIPNLANISVALDHYVEHLQQQADRVRHTEASRCLTGLKKEILAPLTTKVSKQRKKVTVVNRKKDAEKLGNLPPPKTLQEGIFDSMVILHWATEVVKVMGGEADWHIKVTANALMAGLIFTNSYAGRPGEWANLKRAKAEKMLAEGEEWLEMKEHKTDDTYGSAGRPVPAGNREAMKRILMIHPADAELFMNQAKEGKTGPISIHKALEKWSHKFFPNHQEVGATLQRKLMHTKPQQQDVAQKVFDEICAFDKHRTQTGLTNYVAKQLEVEAQKGAIIYRNVIGDPVDWPTPEQLKAGKKKALKALQELTTRAKKATEQGVDEEDGAEDGSDWDQSDAEDGTMNDEEGGGEDAEDAGEEAVEGGEAQGSKDEEGCEAQSPAAAGPPAEAKAEHVVTDEAKDWLRQKYQGVLARKKLPVDHVPKPFFWETLQKNAVKQGQVTEDVSADTIKDIVMSFKAEKTKKEHVKAEEKEEDEEDGEEAEETEEETRRKRRKISPGLLQIAIFVSHHSQGHSQRPSASPLAALASAFAAALTAYLAAVATS